MLLSDVSALQSVPACLRHVILGGEAVKLHAVQQWLEHVPNPVGLWNTYGPTETTIVCTAARLDKVDLFDGRPAPIGRAVANAQAWVLDNNLQHLPAGAVGTLYIGGHTLARGYHGRDDLTAEVFIDNPFGEGRLYNTGDRVRWREDGQLEYLGRADSQLKIRGFRIEPGEIQKNLESLTGVKEAVVAVKVMNGSDRLTAYVVPAEGHSLQADSLRASLSTRLAEYMVPNLYVNMASLPLTPNGKVDLKALPEPTEDAIARGAVYVEPESDAEKSLAGIWRDLLNVQQVGVDDNFFELGGDSILSLQLVSRAQSEGLSFSVRDVFRYQRLGELASVAENAVQTLSETGPVVGMVDLLPSQYCSDHVYTTSVRVELNASTSEDAVQQALAAVTEHHDGLRAQLIKANGVWQQQYAAPDAFTAVVRRLSSTDVLEEVLELSTDTDEGNVAQAAFACGMYGDTDNVDQLVLVANTALVDAASLRIVRDDLIIALAAIQQAQTPKFAAKTTSLRQLGQRMLETGTQPVGLLMAEETAKPRSWQQIVTAEKQPFSISTLDEARAKFGLSRNEFIRIAFARAYNSADVVLAEQLTGRDTSDKLIDLSRTVGPLVQARAQLFECSDNRAEDVISAKEASRAPITEQMKPEIAYLGNLDGDVEELQPQSSGADLQLLAHIDGEHLRFDWQHASNLSSDALTALLARFDAELNALVALCASMETAQLTPSDFPLATGLQRSDLDRLVANNPAIEDIYIATPGQVAMLYHAQMAGDEAAVFMLQSSVDFNATLDPDCLHASFDDIIARHTSNRTML